MATGSGRNTKQNTKETASILNRGNIKQSKQETEEAREKRQQKTDGIGNELRRRNKN